MESVLSKYFPMKSNEPVIVVENDKRASQLELTSGSGPLQTHHSALQWRDSFTLPVFYCGAFMCGCTYYIASTYATAPLHGNNIGYKDLNFETTCTRNRVGLTINNDGSGGISEVS